MVEQERLTKDFEKWMHRKCAFESDEIVNPKEYAREVELCFRCGEGLENPVRGPLYLYEVGEVGESISRTKLYDVEFIGEDVDAITQHESIPVTVIHEDIGPTTFGPVDMTEIREMWDEEVESILLNPRGMSESIPFISQEDAPSKETVMIIDEVQSEDAGVSEEVVPAEQPSTDGDADTPEENVTATLEDQIAALRAKIDAYEAEKE